MKETLRIYGVGGSKRVRFPNRCESTIILAAISPPTATFIIDGNITRYESSGTQHTTDISGVSYTLTIGEAKRVEIGEELYDLKLQGLGDGPGLGPYCDLVVTSIDSA